jgi:hypothetical protein
MQTVTTIGLDIQLGGHMTEASTTRVVATGVAHHSPHADARHAAIDIRRIEIEPLHAH